MAIARKPKTPLETRDVVDVEALINRGGGVGPSQTESASDTDKPGVAFTLRLSGETLARLDEHIKKQPYKIPRQQWIVEAILQRLERESEL